MAPDPLFFELSKKQSFLLHKLGKISNRVITMHKAQWPSLGHFSPGNGGKDESILLQKCQVSRPRGDICPESGGWEGQSEMQIRVLHVHLHLFSITLVKCPSRVTTKEQKLA